MARTAVIPPMDFLCEAELKPLSRIASRILTGRPAFAAGSHALGRRAGQGTDFLDYRDYQPGDDARTIDWRASGRSRQTKVKRYSSDVASDWFICIDASSSMAINQGEKWLMASKLAAALSYILLDLGHRVSVLAYSSAVDALCPLGRGHVQYARILNALSGHSPQSRGAGSALASCTKYLGVANPVIVLSDFLAPDAMCAELGRFWQQQRQIHALQVISTEEFSLPDVEELLLEDVETREQCAIADAGGAMRLAGQEFTRLRRNLNLWCAQHQVHFTSCKADEAVSAILMRHFTKAGRKGA